MASKNTLMINLFLFSIPLNMSKPINIYHSFNTSYSQFVMHLKILITFHSNVMHHGIGVKIDFKGFIAFEWQ